MQSHVLFSRACLDSSYLAGQLDQSGEAINHALCAVQTSCSLQSTFLERLKRRITSDQFQYYRIDAHEVNTQMLAARRKTNTWLGSRDLFAAYSPITTNQKRCAAAALPTTFACPLFMPPQ